MNAIGGHHSHRAESNVWLTPQKILTALGPFDLDPCAAPTPRPWPTAAHHICPPDDGLSAEWHGRVWLNPPYRQVDAWMAKLADHGHGTALVFARTETQWFIETVWSRATAVLFLHSRLHFCLPDGTRAPGNAGAPSCLVAYGAADAAALATPDLTGTWLPLKTALPAADGELGSHT
jgi:hypothetical protein